jgi:pimeloyl-ACP methyl ester carboxylesterase
VTARVRVARMGHVGTQPDTRYAESSAVSIAYQVVGDGSVDLVLVPGFVSHVEVAWEEPRLARFLTRLASFSRLIVFDKRSTGMSDPVPSTAKPRTRPHNPGQTRASIKPGAVHMTSPVRVPCSDARQPVRPTRFVPAAGRSRRRWPRRTR